MWTWTLWEQFLQDLRYGLRTMAANPLFTAIATISLALGIGANTAIFSFMDAILLRNLPVKNPQELVVFHWRAKDAAGCDPWHDRQHVQRPETRQNQSRISRTRRFRRCARIRTCCPRCSPMRSYPRLNIVAQRQAEFAQGLYVSGGFYAGLGVTPAVGRLIGDEDDHTGAPPVTVLSWAYWQRRFNANPAVVGQSILINNQPFTIIGVSAPEFFGVNPGARPEVYVPLHAVPALSTFRQRKQSAAIFSTRNYYWVEMMGRLRPGVSREQAQT